MTVPEIVMSIPASPRMSDSLRRSARNIDLVVVDAAARIRQADHLHEWTPDDFPDLRVPPKVRLYEWTFAAHFIEELGIGEGWRPAAAYLYLRRVTRTESARKMVVSAAPEWKEHLAALPERGHLAVAELLGSTKSGRAFVVGEARWIIDESGAMFPRPGEATPRPFVAPGPWVSETEGRDDGEALRIVQRHLEAMLDVVVIATSIMNTGAAVLAERTTRPADELALASKLGDATVESRRYRELSVDVPAALTPPALEALDSEIRARGPDSDLEGVARRLGIPYALASERARSAGIRRRTPEARRLAEAAEAERKAAMAEIERRRAEEERLRREREEIARREEDDRLRVARDEEERRRARLDLEKRRDDNRRRWREMRARLREERRARVAADEERRRAERDEERERRRATRKVRPSGSLSAVVEPRPTPPTPTRLAQVVEPARVGARAWDDDTYLFHEGKEWRVVFAEDAGGRLPGQEFLEEVGVRARADLDSMKATIMQAADDPSAHVANDRRFKALSTNYGLLCEVKKQGHSGHPRLFCFRDSRKRQDGSPERRIVLLTGYFKQTNETPESEFRRAANLRDLWLSKREAKERGR